MSPITRLLCAAALLAAPQGYSQQFFPFTIDQDQLSGAPDLSLLNRSLNPGDQLKVCGEHFCRSSDGGRVRLFGVNLAFGANFPKEEDAPRIAKRLRRFGVNLVRLHHMDSSPDRNPSDARSTLTTGPYPTLNPVSIARLRALLDALRAEGIYADLNLHVGYTFRPEVDSVPALPQFPQQSKPLHIFYPRMVDLQCDYTRKLIQALKLRDDPVLGIVEINNESSLIYAWQNNQLDSYLAGDYRIALEREWNAWLTQRYGATEKLRAAWGVSAADGPEILPGKWNLEAHGPAKAADETADGVLTVRLEKAGASVIAKQAGFTIDKSRAYVAEVELRADLPDHVTRNIHWDLKRDVSPWDQVANKNIAVGSQWKRFRLAVQVPSAAFDHVGRFGLELQELGAGVTLQVRNASLRQAGTRGLNAGESLEAGNVALMGDDVATRQRLDDYCLFLASIDRQYLQRMLAAVRETAGPVVPVAGTQIRYGGLMNLETHDDLSFQDNHFYIDHYNFPNQQWDTRDWRQKNTSAIATGLAELAGMAIERQGGRPYTVSEFNMPWPNQQANEIDVVTAALGAFQDWDSIMHFAYSHSADWSTDVPNNFNINGDWSKDVLLAQAAWLFRSGAIEAGNTPLDVPVSRDLRLRALREKQNWNTARVLAEASGIDLADVFVRRVRMVKDGTTAKAPAKPEAPYQADTKELTYDPERRLFLIHAPEAAGVFGYPGEQPVITGPLELKLAASARGYASILLTSLDGHALTSSRHLLLSTPGYITRSQTGSNPPVPQKIVNYPGTTNWWTLEPDPGSNRPSGDLNRGVGPVWMERVESTIRFTTVAGNLRVYPLSGTGARLAPLTPKDVEQAKAGFILHLQREGQELSPWFEIVASQ
ncbi:MAG TPA: hypothetical protein VGL72_21540 [Bryobacteraceae bacterium]|jgi:hypothetical protein